MTAAKQLGIEVDPASSLPQLILTMAEKILGKLSDEEKLQLLRKRLPKQDDVQGLLMAQENLDELLEKDDHEQIVKGKEDRAALKREFSEYSREYSAKARLPQLRLGPQGGDLLMRSLLRRSAVGILLSYPKSKNPSTWMI